MSRCPWCGNELDAWTTRGIEHYWCETCKTTYPDTGYLEKARQQQQQIDARNRLAHFVERYKEDR